MMMATWRGILRGSSVMELFSEEFNAGKVAK
jgi:hypothetical protein